MAATPKLRNIGPKSAAQLRQVGVRIDDDLRRLRLARETVGPDVALAVDANQRWDVGTAIDWVNALAPFDLRWIEEPTSPDDSASASAIARGVAE